MFIPSQHLKKTKTLNAKLPVSSKSFLPSRFLMGLQEKNKMERAQDKFENPQIFAVEEARVYVRIGEPNPLTLREDEKDLAQLGSYAGLESIDTFTHF